MVGHIWAAQSYVYNPYSQLAKTINSAADTLAGYFNEIDFALDKGKSVKQAIGSEDKIRSVVKRIISSARLEGFQHGAKVTKMKMPSMYGNVIKSAADRRASKVNKWMNGTTKNVLRSNVDSEHVLSRDRALMAMRFEASKAYYDGVRDATVGTGMKKRWITSSEESCQDCQDNEEQGPLDIDAVFASGDDFPAAHQNCNCYVSVSK